MRGMSVRQSRLPFDLHALEAFLAVCEARSMAAAAKKLSLTQPAISAQIRALEEELGVRLFERSKRHVALTTDGEALLPYARRLVGILGGGLRVDSAPGVGSTFTVRLPKS